MRAFLHAVALLFDDHRESIWTLEKCHQGCLTFAHSCKGSQCSVKFSLENDPSLYFFYADFRKIWAIEKQ
jgi:hypothetical protein